jgi:hypothetical protein
MLLNSESKATEHNSLALEISKAMEVMPVLADSALLQLSLTRV